MIGKRVLHFGKGGWGIVYKADLLLVNAAPHFDPMRDEGDFNALLKRLGIVA